MAPNQKIAVWLKGTPVGKKGALIRGRGAAAACADEVEKCCGQRRSQNEVVNEIIMHNRSVVVVRVRSERVFLREEVWRREEKMFWL